MANKNEKFSRIVEYKGIFDASQILASFKKLEQELGKRGTSEADILNLDGEVKKVEQLNKTIQKMISKGFKTPKEFNDFTKLTNQMSSSLSHLSERFKEVDASTISNQMKNANTQTKLLEAKVKGLVAGYENAVKRALNEGDARRKILEATKQNINNLKEGKNAENGIKKMLEDELKVLQAKTIQAERDKDAAAQEVERLKEKKALLEDINNYASQNNQAFGKTYLTSSNYVKVGEDGAKTALNNSEMSNVTSAITEAFKKGGDLDALAKSLKKYNIELVEGARDAALFVNAAKEYNRAIKENKTATDEAEKSYNKLFNAYGKALNNESKLSTALGDQGTLLHDLEAAATAAQNYATAQKNVAEINERTKYPLQGLSENARLQTSLNTSLEQGIEATRATIREQRNLDSTFDQISNRFKYMLSFMSVWNTSLRTVRQTFEDIKGIDKAFASIAMVTDYDISGLWEQYDDYAKIANELGQSTESVIQSSALYYQQGLQTQEVLSLTKDTMKLATLANIDFSESTKLMTSALRSFHMEMEEGAHVTDVYSELAAHAAADVQGIAYAMSKTASIAASAGMDFEKLAAMLTTMIEVTQEAPENLGTAMKSVVARFTEVKKNVSDIEGDLEDMDINKVDAALKSVGISLKDQAGQIRDLDDVFLELSAIWNDLDRNSQRYRYHMELSSFIA